MYTTKYFNLSFTCRMQLYFALDIIWESAHPND